MTAHSGRRCVDLYAKYSPLGSLVKTLLESKVFSSTRVGLLWKAKAISSHRYLEQEYVLDECVDSEGDHISMEYWKTLNQSDIPSSRLLFRLVPSTLPTDGIESGLWPTAHGFSQDGKSHGPGGNELGRAVNQSLMPTATTDTSSRKRRYAQGGMPLSLFATATATANQLSPSMQKHPGCREMQQDQFGGSLNPQWVEWLMGYPDGWTDLNR